VDTTVLGKASLEAKLPELPELGDARIAVIGGGPAGLSVAWQLRREGHQATIYEMAGDLGGKFTRVIPSSRIPREVIAAELDRIKRALPTVNLQQPLTRPDVEQLRDDYDFVVLATGAQKPRLLPVAGIERALTALDFLLAAKQDQIEPGKNVVVIGAGNVGCDAATEAYRLGARSVTLLDVQKPASFGREREAAEGAGAKFRWPVMTREITADAVVLTDGEKIAADTVIISIGDVPELDFVPETVAIEKGYVSVDENFRTSDPKILAIGDVVRPGLLTDAIGSGRLVARAISDTLAGKTPAFVRREMIDRSRISLEYFDPRITDFVDLNQCGSQCSSCGACRDCHVCANICPQGAIDRKEAESGGYEYVVDESLCIGCGFCGAACPCGVWSLTENDPMD
jgi:NADPH-dependent glutamate synthase beta subunit-like oxidoreductase/NAD-dependent dihydropyrimidine dehydrogenase PreA subunit